MRRGDEHVHARLASALAAARASGRSGAEWLELDGRRVYLKHGPLRSTSRLRHGWRALLGTPPPRVREFDNLAWLRAHGFAAAEPVAAGADLRLGSPVFQFLATAEVEHARTVRDLLEDERTPGGTRTAIARGCGALARRLHDAGFAHRDLFPRNLLIAGEDTGSPVLLDAWAGGPGRARSRSRGAAYDLACLLLHATTLLSTDERRALVRSYLDEEVLSPRSVRFLRRVAAVRLALVERLERLERRGRTRPGIPTGDDRDWDPNE